MTTFVFFVGMIVFLILWLTKKTNVQSDEQLNYYGKNYSQGYWDGVRAHEHGIVNADGTTNSKQPDLNPDFNTATNSTNVAAQYWPNSDNNVAVVAGPELSDAERKAKHDLQNINTTLYVASFLLVAAVALFIGTTILESVRFGGVWFITLMFYIVGMLLHDNVKKLQPAAVAFIGTGLAMIPFTGIAMYNLVLADGPICWLITSIIGLIAFLYASIRLKSRVVSYFAIAFLISLVTSSVATVGAGLVWYFVVLIIFGSFVTLFSKIKPNWVPDYISEPIIAIDKIMVPLTLVASMFAFMSLTVTDYWVISLIGTIYYVILAGTSSTGRREIILVARIIGSVSLLLMAYNFSDSWTTVGMAASAIGFIQVLISCYFMPEHKLGDVNNETWLWLGLSMQLLATLFVISDVSWAAFMTVQLLVLLATCLGASYYLRRAYISLFGTAALVALPIIISRELIYPSLEYQWTAIIFVTFAVVSVLLRSAVRTLKLHPSLKDISLINVDVFGVLALLFTLGADAGIGFGVTIVLAELIYYLTYLERKPWLSILANFIFLIAIGWFISLINIQLFEWQSFWLSIIAFVIFYGIYLVLSQVSRSGYAVYFWWSAIVVATLVNILNISPETSVVSGFALAVIALIMIIKGFSSEMHLYIDAGAVVGTIGLQRVIAYGAPDLDLLVYTHWWAIVIAILGYFYYIVGKKTNSRVRTIIALAIISFFGATAALFSFGNNTETYRLIFLFEHVAILIAGLVLTRKIYAIWGAIGVVLVILWMLSSSMFLFLAFAAFVLIGVAVMALLKQAKK